MVACTTHRRGFVFACTVLLALLATIPLYGKETTGTRNHDGQPFTRIISLYSGHTENICSMGGADRLIGISTSDDYPPEILNLPRFSYRDDPEKFIAAAPDLVLVRPMIERSQPQLLTKLRAVGITVVSLQPNSMADMFAYWQELGQLSGHQQEAATMIQTFRENIEHMRQQLQRVGSDKRPRVYFEAIHSKMKTFAPDSIGAFVLEQAGGINVASDAEQVRTTNIGFYGKEKLLAKGQEIDVFLAQQGKMNPITIDEIREEPGFMAIRAVRDNRIFLVDEQLVSRPTLRILDGIDHIHKLLYGAGQAPDKEQ